MLDKIKDFYVEYEVGLLTSVVILFVFVFVFSMVYSIGYDSRMRNACSDYGELNNVRTSYLYSYKQCIQKIDRKSLPIVISNDVWNK